MVWSLETASNECDKLMATDRCHRVLLVHCFFEYCLMVPANRIGFVDNGGPFTLMQLKVIQEVVSLTVFTVVAGFLFQGEQLHWNHFAAFVCLILAVYFVFMK